MPRGDLAPPSEAVAVTRLLGEGSLLDAVDRLLDVGVVAAGEATISVAGVDLIYLGLNVVLSSVETLRRADRPRAEAHGLGSRSRLEAGSAEVPPGNRQPALAGLATFSRGLQPSATAAAVPPRPDSPHHIDFAPESAEQGLVKLVLTLVEFIRQLLERQAVRRMEGGGLGDDEVERLGLALLRLREQLWLMAAQFGLRPEELNLDLGPLGTLS